MFRRFRNIFNRVFRNDIETIENSQDRRTKRKQSKVIRNVKSSVKRNNVSPLARVLLSSVATKSIASNNASLNETKMTQSSNEIAYQQNLLRKAENLQRKLREKNPHLIRLSKVDNIQDLQKFLNSNVEINITGLENELKEFANFDMESVLNDRYLDDKINSIIDNLHVNDEHSLSHQQIKQINSMIADDVLGVNGEWNDYLKEQYLERMIEVDHEEEKKQRRIKEYISGVNKKPRIKSHTRKKSNSFSRINELNRSKRKGIGSRRHQK